MRDKICLLEYSRNCCHNSSSWAQYCPFWRSIMKIFNLQNFFKLGTTIKKTFETEIEKVDTKMAWALFSLKNVRENQKIMQPQIFRCDCVQLRHKYNSFVDLPSSYFFAHKAYIKVSINGPIRDETPIPLYTTSNFVQIPEPIHGLKIAID